MAKVAIRKSAVSTLLTGLVAYWPLSEVSGERNDLCAGAHHLTDNNAVASAAGHVSALAATFARADDPARYLSTPMHADFDFDGQQPFTVAAWFKLDSQYDLAIPFYSYLIGGVAGPGAGSGWNFFLSGLEVVLYLGNGSSNTVTHAGTITLGQWHLGFGWYDPDAATNNAQVYGFDPDVVADLTGPADNAAADLIVGCNAKTIGYRPWDGEIGPVMLWDRVITGDERTELWNSGNGIAYPF